MKTLVAYFSATGTTEAVARDLDWRDKQFRAQYPDINWKTGKLLNGATIKVLQDWAASNK